MPLDDALLNELAWQSYRDCHTPAERSAILARSGESFFRDRAHYHTGILKAAFTLLEAKGYHVVKNPGFQEDYADIC